jgi:hypothetical protein
MRRLALPVALAFAAAIGGCGGSSNGVSDAQFKAKANSVCAAALRRAAHLATPTSRTGLAFYFQEASSIAGTLIGELGKVKPPAGSRSKYERLVSIGGEEAHRIASVASALRTHDDARARAALQSLQSNRYNEQARALGLTECARSISTR